MLVSETGEAPPPLPTAPGCPPSPSTSSSSSSSEGSASRWTSAAPVEGRSWSARAVLVGLAVGLVICFSNMYFGLQTGWISTMSLPATLMGFSVFKALSRSLAFPFSPAENVLLQSVAGSMGIMPLGCGFVGVLPAINFLLGPKEYGPLQLSLSELMIWSLGLCYFGVVFAVPLRRQVIIREKLKFPSGSATAVLITVLHGKSTQDPGAVPSGFASLVAHDSGKPAHPSEWKANMRLLLVCFLVSGLLTVATYFLPSMRNLPIFGPAAASTWLWTLNPSLAYVGQGIIMGPATTLHMLLGAVCGWALLSPLAKSRGWAPGPVDDWRDGSKGWLVWVALAIMLADATISLAHVSLRPILLSPSSPLYAAAASRLSALTRRGRTGYVTVATTDSSVPPSPSSEPGHDPPSPTASIAVSETWDAADDAPPEQQVGNRVVAIGLVLSVLICIAAVHAVFGRLVPLYATIIAVAIAMVLSVMGVRALGETDLNPVSGISKLAQLFFAVIIPQSNRASVLINLVAGAVSEAGALQAGELMQDLKTGHLLGAAPSAQFYGQIIGATVGAIVSSLVYRLYTTVYPVPGDIFQTPTSFLWIATARMRGDSLPAMATEWAAAAAVLFALLTVVRIYAADRSWQVFIPGGIAVAVGMYNTPSFTLARVIGGLVAWYWRRAGRPETPLVIVASGFILGEGFLSIANLVMQSLGTPHL